MNDWEQKAWQDVVDGLSWRGSTEAHRAILAADAELTRLSALEEKCGDVEGMAKVLYSFQKVWWCDGTEPGRLREWEEISKSAKEPFIKRARAVSRWLKEG